jgi:cytochrome c biogenesis protein CcmG/thiol:disulfide interchange protein DsbE
MDLVISNIDINRWFFKHPKKKTMKKKLLPFFVVIIFGIVFIVFYKGLEDTNIYTPDLNVQKDIPIFNSKDFYSEKVLKSSDIFEFDKTYLLNIWSSWCVPCRQEHPLLMTLKQNDKIDIIGLNYKDNKKNAVKFLQELGNPYEKIFIDLDGTQAIEWGAYGVPESFLIYNNEIIKKYIGPLNEDLISEIKYLIK